MTAAEWLMFMAFCFVWPAIFCAVCAALGLYR